MSMTMFVIVGAVAVVLFMIVSAAVKIVQEYERGVIFRLGRLVSAKGPGLFLILPFVDRLVKHDLPTVTLETPPQEVIPRNNVSLKVNAAVHFRGTHPELEAVRVTGL